jgi:hypothetical protein
VHGKPNKQQQKSHDVFFMSMQKQTTTAESHDVFFMSMEKQQQQQSSHDVSWCPSDLHYFKRMEE